MTTTKTVLVGRNKLFRQGLKSLLADSQFEVVAEMDELAELRHTGETMRPDLVVVDFTDESERASESIADLKSGQPEVRIAVLAEVLDSGALSACLAAGAGGFLIKDISVDGLLQSLRLMMLGETVFPTNLAPLLVNGMTRVEPMRNVSIGSYGLSEREGQIIRCLAQGDSNKQIANRLGITEATVKVHMKSLMRKIRASNRTQAAIWALHNGLGPELHNDAAE